ncbi:MAG TPA: MBL fold metallo-hydrolase, partial [Aestuariivirgaceae bacterium]|nr:MBL fold metallo-hydrolase [Aestuariivirgaceae bacterium]
MSLRLTILGCGSSAGVPRIGGHWGACDPANPKNRRRRCSLLVERHGPGGTTRVLIDTSPDLHDQLLDAGVGELQAVIYTHDHADHTNGIDELRSIALNMRQRVPVWADQRTGETLQSRFSYCFYRAPGSDYPPILELNRLVPGQTIEIDGPGGSIAVLPFEVRHGQIDALGFRIADIAYTPDLNAIPDESLTALADLDVWIIDALRRSPHPSHFTLEESLGWIERLAPNRAVLTNM